MILPTTRSPGAIGAAAAALTEISGQVVTADSVPTAGGCSQAAMKRADRWAGEPFNREPDKCCELAWVDPDALPNDVIAYPAAALAHVQQGAVFSLHGWTTPIA